MVEPSTMRTVFDVPTAGTYHVVSGMQPHLLFEECTPECGTLAADGAAVPIVVEFDTVEAPGKSDD